MCVLNLDVQEYIHICMYIYTYIYMYMCVCTEVDVQEAARKYQLLYIDILFSMLAMYAVYMKPNKYMLVVKLLQ